MSDLPALLWACKEAPDDDVPRLVLADWLEEHDQPERAEFVRLQCRLDDLPATAPDHAVVWARSAALVRRHAPDWLGPLAGRYAGVEFRRGLVWLTATVADLLDRPLEIVPDAVRPWLEGLTLLPQGGDLQALLDRHALTNVTALDLHNLGWGAGQVGKLDHPAAAHLRRLHLWMGYVKEPELLRLLRANFSGLRVLRLAVGDFMPAFGAGLASAPWIGGLRELSVSWYEGKAPNLEALAAARPAALKRLSIHGCKLGDAELAPLAGLPDLAHLDLRRNELTGKGLPALVGAAPWSRLETVRLAENRLGATGTSALAGSSWLKRVSWLDLEETGATAASLAKLLERSQLAHLRRLSLSGNRLGDVGARFLAGAEKLGQLTALSLASAGLTTEGAKHLVGSAALKSLKSLDLSRNSLGTAGLRALGEASGLPGLRGLELSQVQATPEGLAALASGALLPRLERLNLDCNHQGPEALRPLLAAPGLEALRDLDLARNPLGEEGLRLLASLPLWGRLVQLNLGRAELNGQAIVALGSLPTPAALVSLNLSHNPFRDPNPLRTWHHLSRLLRLGLKDANISASEREALQQGPEWPS
jgi:uncharacterized protein (TIGR02996 family)